MSDGQVQVSICGSDDIDWNADKRSAPGRRVRPLPVTRSAGKSPRQRPVSRLRRRWPTAARREPFSKAVVRDPAERDDFRCTRTSAVRLAVQGLSTQSGPCRFRKSGRAHSRVIDAQPSRDDGCIVRRRRASGVQLAALVIEVKRNSDGLGNTDALADAAGVREVALSSPPTAVLFAADSGCQSARHRSARA